jgi:hypothetical protein
VNIATGVLPSHTYSRIGVPALSYSPSSWFAWSYTKTTVLAAPEELTLRTLLPMPS